MSSDSTRPYLIRAIYDWAVDNSLTPFLLVDTQVEGVTVPAQFIKDDSIVLNISSTAVRDLSLGDDYISFSARFAGVSQELFVPIASVRAVYAKENGEGIVLPAENIAQPVLASSNPGSNDQSAPPPIKEVSDRGEEKPKPGKPHLTIVE